jgi:polyphosphate kinase 2
MSETPPVRGNRKAEGGARTEKKADGSRKAQFRKADHALVDLQNAVIDKQRRVLIIVEGRDASGKDGAIRRISKHLSPRDTRIVAPGKPTERDRRAWYFERYTEQLPLAGEIVFFNRSWYNRAGVERVMEFCSEDDVAQFYAAVPAFEQLLTHCGFELIKYYLDVSRDEQKGRLRDRRDNPLKQWKRSPVDDRAIELWKAYSAARDEMLSRTHLPFAPWTVVRADDKRAARLSMMRDLARRLSKKGKRSAAAPDPDVLFPFNPDLLST